MVLLLMLAVPIMATSCGETQSSWTFKVSSDFDRGALFNVEYNDVSGGLVLSEVQTTRPEMWIANAGEDTVSRWDTETNREVARYDTWFGETAHSAWSGAAPSRTCVDSEGNCYVVNSHFNTYPADVFKILTNSFVDRNENGRIDTCTDLNGNGRIGEDELAPYQMADLNGNGIIDDDEIKDERIAWVVTVGNDNGLGRSLSIDPTGYLWLGLYNDQAYYKLSPVDGSVVAGPINVGVTPYGSMVDKHGILWGLNYNMGLLRLDTADNSFSIIPMTMGRCYSLALGYDDDDYTQVYMSSDTGNLSYVQYDTNPATNPGDTLKSPAKLRFRSLGIGTDTSGNIYCSNYDNGGGVTKFAPNGTVVWTAVPQTAYYDNRAALIDSEGNVWVCLLGNSQLAKFDGSTGDHLGVFNCGQKPYTYGDATGRGLLEAIPPQGTWTVVVDSGSGNTEWSDVSWNGDTPAGTEITVRVSSSEDNRIWSGWETLASGEAPSNMPDGRYLKAEVTLEKTSGTESPTLYEFTVTR